MAICKNEIPILELDPEQRAVVMPGLNADFQFPRRAAMRFAMEAVVLLDPAGA